MVLYGDTHHSYTEGCTNSFSFQAQKSESSQWKGNGDRKTPAFLLKNFKWFYIVDMTILVENVGYILC